MEGQRVVDDPIATRGDRMIEWALVVFISCGNYNLYLCASGITPMPKKECEHYRTEILGPSPTDAALASVRCMNLAAGELVVKQR
jgi:hypothetical protein